MATKYRLETIPVWTAVERGTECPLCDLEDESERRNVAFFLGSSVMAPEMRVQVNEHGFCSRHLHLLGEGTGKLGLSLALSTHIEALRARIARIQHPAGYSRKRSRGAANDLAALLEAHGRDCLMCDRVSHNMANYRFTLVTLYKSDGKFRDLFDSSRGVCLRHLPQLLSMGGEILPPSDLADWTSRLVDLADRAMARLMDELEQFSWQFDATSDLKTPPEAQDAVHRAILKISGFGPQSS